MERAPELAGRRRGGAGASLLTLTLALALGLLPSGCGKDDGPIVGPGPDPGPTYLAPTSPQNVLANLVTAYQVRDSTRTAAVYDDAYKGTSTDLTSPAPAILTFTKAEEVSHVRALKLDPNITVVSVDFGPTSTWLRLAPGAGDPPDWAVLQIDQAIIQIQDVSTGSLHQSRPTVMLYAFAPTVQAPDDTTWKIVRWTEIKN